LQLGLFLKLLLGKNKDGDLLMSKIIRKISKERYIVAGIITLLIFTLGLSFGLIIDYERVKYVDRENSLQKVNYDSLQLQYLYLSYVPEDNHACGILKIALEDSISQLSDSLNDVEKYQKDSTINKKEFDIIQRKYLIDNLRYWLFSKKLQEVCGEDTINVLYFFSIDNCVTCPNQGTILSYFKTKLQDKLLVFPINVDLEKQEQFIKILRIQYNITQLPAIIVDGKKYEGVISRNELAEILCEQTTNKEHCLI
jgi:hypothetical protein